MAAKNPTPVPSSSEEEEEDETPALPSYHRPDRVIDLNWGQPEGIAVMSRGEIVVTLAHINRMKIITDEVIQIGYRGSGDGKFEIPAGVTIDSGGNILVADSGNHRIQQFTPTGEHIKSVGEKGRGHLQFKKPTGIAIHPHTQRVYVADTENHRIQILNSDLSYSGCFGREGPKRGQLDNPFGVAIDSDGDIYVSDEKSKIQIFSPDGIYQRRFGMKKEKRNTSSEEESEEESTDDDSSSSDGYISDPGISEVLKNLKRKEKREKNRKIRRLQMEPIDPGYIHIDSNDYLYVCDRYPKMGILIFSSDGEFLTRFGGKYKQLNHAKSVTVDQHGTMYVVDKKFIKVFKIREAD